LKVLNSTKKKPSRSQRYEYGHSFVACFARFRLQQAISSIPTALNADICTSFRDFANNIFTNKCNPVNPINPVKIILVRQAYTITLLKL